MSVTQNNVFVHSSPPKAISSSGAAIRQLVKNGDIDKLETAVLDGQGARLLGLAETTSDTKVKGFLRSVPGLMAKVDLIHDAVIRGSVRETQALLDKKKLAGARDAVGRGLAHKAVLHSNKSVIEWLGKKYPEVLNIRDNENRTCLHYAAACRDPEEMYDFLESLGANPDLVDLQGRKAEYYIKHPDEFDIEGPTRSLSRGKRRKISPTTTPPRKIMSSPLSVTRAQIRILIHERDIPKLEKIVWSGHGEKLLLETTNNSKVRRFLDNVPHLLSRIKSIHTAAINNDVEFLKDVRKRTELPEVFMAKDSHGLTPLHKAAGLSNRGVLEYLIYEMPALIHETDNEGHVPLHFGAKDQNVYAWIMKAGGNENVTDQKGKTPGYYRSHPGELDTRYLRNIPDAPRVSGDISGWDRSSPSVNQTRRRPSINSDFGAMSRDDSGKYGLPENIELREEEFVVDEGMESDFKPRAPLPKSVHSVRNLNNATSAASMKMNGDIRSSAKNDIAYDVDDFEDESPTEEAEAPPPVTENLMPMAEYNLPTEDETMAAVTAVTSAAATKGMSGARRSSVVAAVSAAAAERGLPVQMPIPMQEEEVEGDPTEQPPGIFEVEPDVDAEDFFENEEQEQEQMNGEEEPMRMDAEDEMDRAELDRQAEVEEPPAYQAGGSTKYLESGTDIEIALKNKNMEALVDMILEGRGAELLNQKTDHPDLKEFLLNVPAYMAKMTSIHKAAASGNIRDLQALLDRKRLALAKDPLGRSPLHQAVLFNHNNVARHLASTYPQSLRSLDSDGRSPLHYAATLADSGTLYKYLVNLGADPNVKDSAGNTPGIYLRNRELLSNKDLLSASADLGYGSGPSAVTAIASAAPVSLRQAAPIVDHWERPESPPESIPLAPSSASDQQQRFPAIWSEEGKYLASVLGDALVKGLTQVSQERPADPVEYLANFLKDYHRESGAGSAKPLSSKSVNLNAAAASATMAAAMDVPELLSGDEPQPKSAKEMAKSAKQIAKSAERRPPSNIGGPEEEAVDEEPQTRAFEVVTETINENNNDDRMTPDSEDEDNIRKLNDEVDVGEDDAVEEEDDNNAQQMRDEHGQSVLHLAASRPGGAHTIFAFLQNPSVNLAWRDENLKTARDVAAQMSRSENLQTIDSYVVSLAVQGNVEGLQRLLYDGYDHLTDIKDSVQANIVDSVPEQLQVVAFLKSVEGTLDKLDKLHNAVRAGKLEEVKRLAKEDGKLVSTMGPLGRTALHLAVLLENHAIVQYIAQEFPETLKRGDHLERMPLHYAMGVEKVEKMTRILVRAGAKRVVKDLRGRQPSYYFINREEIAIMQEEEDGRRVQ